MGEIKQTNFRIDNETADKFREFCEEQGMNQAQGFDHIMQILEMDQAKVIVPERAVEIEEFERHTKAILSGYLTSLEIAKKTEERVLEQFRSRLDSKDKLIEDLQGQVEAQRELAVAANTAAMEAENKQKQAEEAEKQAKERAVAAEKTAADKVAIAEMLQSKLTEAEAKLIEYPGLKKANDERAEKIQKLQQALKDTVREAEIEQERTVATIQKEMDKALVEKEQMLAATELAAEKALMALEKEKNAENQKLRDKIDSLKDERADLKEANAKLQAEIERLQAKVAALTPAED